MTPKIAVVVGSEAAAMGKDASSYEAMQCPSAEDRHLVKQSAHVDAGEGEATTPAARLASPTEGSGVESGDSSKLAALAWVGSTVFRLAAADCAADVHVQARLLVDGLPVCLCLID